MSCLTWQWRHNGRDSVSNNQPHDCLLNRLFGRRSKKTSKLHVTGLCVGNSSGTGEFPALMASNAENVSIWWRHHEVYHLQVSSGSIVVGTGTECDDGDHKGDACRKTQNTMENMLSMASDVGTVYLQSCYHSNWCHIPLLISYVWPFMSIINHHTSAIDAISHCLFPMCDP